MPDANAKQQIVEKLKNSTNILVTVGSSPSVDELSAALALSLMLNRMDKHATAVFSGAIPPAIEFLEPEKTFENTVDSLRDFIIALDKEKADRLRYKVEDDMVRIFITPYKTVIGEEDLEFSQGDFNVELVVALGVERREDLDAAIIAHGRILHDATVVTINRTDAESSLGSIDWYDTEAGSFCEMLMSISEALQGGLLDEQIATALLTGIVASTDRFRNEHTTPKVMTMSAQLMVAGANQQLIADKLEQGHGLAGSTEPGALAEGDVSEKIEDSKESSSEADGSLQIDHTEPVQEQTPAEPGDDALRVAEAELAENLEKAVQPAAPTQSLSELENELNEAQQELEQPQPPVQAEVTPQPTEESPQGNTPQIVKEHRTWQTDETAETPSFGGTLNATASDAEEEKRREEASGYNRQILSHDAPGVADTPADEGNASDTPVDSTLGVAPPVDDTVQQLPPLPPLPAPDDTPLEQSAEDTMLNYEPAPVAPSGPTLAEIDEQTRGKAADEARAAVDAVLDDMPFDPANQPLEASGAIPAIQVDHSGNLITAADMQPQPTMGPAPMQPAPQVDSMMPPPLPPLPDFSTLPPLPTDQPGMSQPMPVGQPMAQPEAAQPVAPQPTDPGQFRIPGQ